MSLAKGRRLLDSAAKQLATLGSVSTNGIVPSYSGLRSLWSLPAGKYHHDNTSGFDEPYEQATTWGCRRHRCGDRLDIMHDRTKADLVMEVSVMDGSDGSRDVKWVDDTYYGDILTYAQNSWKKERALDVRHLSNEEFEAFKTIIDRAVTAASSFNSWCSVHYRCTLDQVKYFVDRKAIQTKPWPFFVNYDAKSYVAEYMRYADPAIVAGAARIFPILNKLKI